MTTFDLETFIQHNNRASDRLLQCGGALPDGWTPLFCASLHLLLSWRVIDIYESR